MAEVKVFCIHSLKHALTHKDLKQYSLDCPYLGHKKLQTYRGKNTIIT